MTAMVAEPIATATASSPTALPSLDAEPEGEAFRSDVVDIHCGWGATAFAPGWGDAAPLQAALRRRGIGMALLASDLARRYDPIAGNEQVSALLAQTPNMRGWLVIHSTRAHDANVQMRRFLYGDRFVGCALYPDPLSGRVVTYRAAAELLNAYRRFGKPLLIEAQDGEAMRHVAEIAREVPAMRIIAAGMGGDDWREAVDLAVKPINLYLDISGALTAEKVEYALATLGGPKKLLFGSGAPGTDPAAVLGLLDDLELSADDRSRILGRNAARLLSLDGGAATAADEGDESSAPGLARITLDE